MAAVVAIVAVVLVTRPWDRAENEEPSTITRTGSTELAGAADIDPADELESWRIVYRVERQSGEIVIVSTDDVAIRRPFEGRRLSKEGAPPGGEVTTSQIAAFGRRTDTGGAEPLGLMVSPGVPPTDLRFAPAFGEAEEQGYVERREVRRVAGRSCQVWRSGGFLSVTTMTKPTEDNHTDSCVDAKGLLLEELQVSNGDVLVRRVAVSVDERPTLEDRDFDPGTERLPPDKGGGSVQRMKEGTGPPGDQFEVAADPPVEGFVRHGRYTVIPPQPEAFADVTREGERRAAFTTVWTRGIDHLYLEQGGTLQGAEPFPDVAGSRRVDLPSLGGASAEIIPSGLGNQVRAKLPGGRWVSVGGTLPLDQLLEVARTLRQVPGPGNLEVEPL